MAEKLEAYIEGSHGIEDLYEGQVKRNQEALSLFSGDVDLQQAVHKWMANRKVPKLLELWVKGLDLDWSKLYGEAKPLRISLPTYPFAKERYWIDTAASSKGTVTAVFHPLLHSNASDLSEQRYNSTFTGEEFFLVDHQLKPDARPAQKVLPGVAYLEMARAAVEQAWAARPDSALLELHNTVWTQPIVVTQNKQISMTLLANDHEQIEYEVYSHDSGQEIVHCQGRAVWSRQPAGPRIDLEQLKAQMGQGQLSPDSVYPAFASGRACLWTCFSSNHRDPSRERPGIGPAAVTGYRRGYIARLCPAPQFDGWCAAGCGRVDRCRV